MMTKAFASLPRFRATTLAAAILASASLAACTTAQQGTPPAHASKPPAGTAAASSLEHITQRIQADVSAGRIPGAVMLIAQHGSIVYNQAVGTQDPRTGSAMRTDSIFRIYSMTKPIVSVAALQLVEQGRIQLGDPIGKYLPEMANLQVGTERSDTRGNTTLDVSPARRPVTVQDLLRHTSGLTYGVFGKGLVKSEYLKAGIHQPDLTNAAMTRKLGSTPLMFEPGTTWEYSRSTDVLGALIERVTGQPLDLVLKQQILDPLGMADSGFWIDADKRSRQAEAFEIDPDTRQAVKLTVVDQRPSFLSGGGGMVSTAGDYLRFAQMLLNKGELDAVRILSPEMVEFMTSDHLAAAGILKTSLQRGAAYLPGPGYGFGLGVGVRISEGGPNIPGNVGDYYWGGLGGTYFWVDPKQDLVAIWMMQAPGQRTHYRSLFRSLVYSTIR